VQGPLKQAKNSILVGCGTAAHSSWLTLMDLYRNYNAKAITLKTNMEKTNFCSCNTTCKTSECELASKLTSETACCELITKQCTVEHPGQADDVYANVLQGCCKACVMQNLAKNKELYHFNNMAYFSSIGPAMDGRIKPDIVAPGFQTFSSKAHGFEDPQICNAESANDVTFNLVEKSGTSMATPTLSGVAALVRQYFTDGFYPTGKANAEHAMETVSSALLKAVLLSSARPMSGFARTAKGLKDSFSAFSPAQRRFFEGHGLVNLANTLSLQGISERSLYVTERKITTNQIHTFTVTLSGTVASSDLSVTLVWTDPAGVPSASIALVNDLDLTVTAAATNTVMLGNAADSTMTSPDRLNNVEKVIIPAAASNGATYRVQVKGFNVPMGAPQSYALVISADKTNDVSFDYKLIDGSFTISEAGKGDQDLTGKLVVPAWIALAFVVLEGLLVAVIVSAIVSALFLRFYRRNHVNPEAANLLPSGNQ